jgi:hypothetical protein
MSDIMIFLFPTLFLMEYRLSPTDSAGCTLSVSVFLFLNSGIFTSNPPTLFPPKINELRSMRVAEKLNLKGLKIKKSIGNRKIIMSDEVRHSIGKG